MTDFLYAAEAGRHPLLSNKPLGRCSTSANLQQLGDDSSAFEFAGFKPIKRSRSDQSLSSLTGQQALAAAGGALASISAGGGCGSTPGSRSGDGSGMTSLPYPQLLRTCMSEGAPLLPGQQQPQQPYGRVQRLPSLPVVLSDVSSSNSLLSLDSLGELAHSASQQQLMAAAAHGGATPRTVEPAAALRLSPSENALLLASQQHQQQGEVVYSLNPVSSAASFGQFYGAQQSLSQAGGASHAGSCMTRTTSDASFSSVGTSSAAAAPQQGGLAPLLGCSPPPLLPPGDPADAAAAGGAAPPPGYRCGLSIQQQKQASFVKPEQRPRAPAAAAVRPVASSTSLYSSDSIASVEAERLASLYGLHSHHSIHCTPPAPAAAAGNGISAAAAHHQQSPAAAAGLSPPPSQLPPLSPQVSGAAAGSSGLLGRGQQQPGSAGLRSGNGASVTPSPGAAATNGLTASPHWATSESGSVGAAAGSSPAIQLQSMGSMLGEDGWLLAGEASTGAIGPGLAALSPVPHFGAEQLAQHDRQVAAAMEAVLAGDAYAPLPQQQQQQQQQQQHYPVETAATLALPVSHALPTGCSAAVSLPCPQPNPRGSFGFGGSSAASSCGVAAAAAAAAAQLGLLGPTSSGTITNTNSGSAFAPLSHKGGPYVSAPLPKMPSLPSGGGSGRSSFAGTPSQQPGDGWPLPHRPRSQQQEAGWSFARRPASFDCARTSLSGRRRGSLELNMPWRKTIDAAIAAKAAAEPELALGDLARRSSSASGASSGGQLTGVALELAASEAEGAYGAGAVAPPSAWQRPRSTRRLSQLELLCPLVEADAEAPASPAPRGAGPGSIGPASMGSGGYDDGGASSRGSSSGGRRSGDSGSTTSGVSVAADHDLPGSTNLGGYIGGSDGLGLARGSMDASPTAMAAAAAAAAAAAKHLLHQAASAPTLQLHQHELQQQGGALYAPECAGAGAGQRSNGGSFEQHVHRLAQEQVVVVMQSGSEDGGSSSTEDDEDEDDGAMPRRSWGSGREQASAMGTAHVVTGSSSGSLASISSGSAGAAGGGGVSGSCGPSSTHESRCASRDLELFVRLNRARQTLDFAKRQAAGFAELDRAELSIWEALDLLDTLPEVEARLLAAGGSGSNGSSGGGGGGGGSALQQQQQQQLSPDMSLKQHAFQTAELCRLAFPDRPWMALVGLLHGLGKLLSHPHWGSQPAWAVAGESFPVGCRFAPQIGSSEFFSANPDRRRRALSTPLGVYAAGCGLRNVYMSWGAPEYLYMALVLNQTDLPEEALALLRYQRADCLTRGAYRVLMCAEDVALLPLLEAFQSLVAYRRRPLPDGALTGAAFVAHYDALIATYLGEERLYW